MNVKISCITSLYRCGEYLENFLSHLRRVENLSEIEFIFIHNDPLPDEVEIISKFIDTYSLNIVYLKVPRESLYASWNRAIRIANGRFITMWNVDDIRFPNSFILQSRALEKHEDVGLVYGNRYISKQYDSDRIEAIETKNIRNDSWYKKFQGGCFYMWKRSLHESIGYFDEQFISLADQDFWYRVVEKYRIKKINQRIGIYLNDHAKGISKTSNISGIEKIVVGARHGFFTYIDFLGWKKAIQNYEWRIIEYRDETKKCSIFKYKSLWVYIYSLYVLLLSILVVVTK